MLGGQTEKIIFAFSRVAGEGLPLDCTQLVFSFFVSSLLPLLGNVFWLSTNL